MGAVNADRVRAHLFPFVSKKLSFVFSPTRLPGDGDTLHLVTSKRLDGNREQDHV
jgi:hypothetical protein